MDIVRVYLQRIKNELYPASERAFFQRRLLKAFSGISRLRRALPVSLRLQGWRSRAGQSNSTKRLKMCWGKPSNLSRGD